MLEPQRTVDPDRSVRTNRQVDYIRTLVDDLRAPTAHDDVGIRSQPHRLLRANIRWDGARLEKLRRPHLVDARIRRRRHEYVVDEVEREGPDAGRRVVVERALDIGLRQM